MTLLTSLSHLAATGVLAAVPNPPPAPVPGLQAPLSTIIGWGKWLMFFLGVIGILICAGQMTLGRRNRHAMSADGAAGIPWVLGGLSLAAISSPLVATFIHP